MIPRFVALYLPGRSAGEMLARLRAAATLDGRRTPEGIFHWFEGPCALATLPGGDGPAGPPVLAASRLWIVAADTALAGRDELAASLAAARAVLPERPSDPELLLAGYEHFGSELPSRLSGAFAFALFDRRTRRLLLARDPGGARALVLRTGEAGVAAASDPDSLAVAAVAELALRPVAPLPAGEPAVFDGR